MFHLAYIKAYYVTFLYTFISSNFLMNHTEKLRRENNIYIFFNTAWGTQKERLYVCVLGELLGGGWRAVKSHIVDAKASQHQRADSGCEGSLSNPLFQVLVLSLHTLKYT